MNNNTKLGTELPQSLLQCFVFDYRDFWAAQPSSRQRAIAIWRAFRYPKRRLTVTFRASQFYRGCFVRGRIAAWLFNRAQTVCGCEINANAAIGPGLKLPHPNGIVIGYGVIAGRNLTVFQQVTLGAKKTGKGGKESEYPRLGDDVCIYAGAKIVGPITVGDRAQIGCNAVVIRDVPCDATAVGVPAKNLV